MSRLRSFRWAAWLGWQIESNWTEWWLFLIYVVVKPLCGSLLLVFMYYAVRRIPGSTVSPEFLPYLYVSNACYALVGSVAFGMSWAVITDREHYGMLKYVFLSPVHLATYFAGRGVAGAAEAVLGAAINLSAGALFFPEVRGALTAYPTEWGWLIVHLLLGTALLVALGLTLAAVVMQMARHAMFLSEGVAGMLYLLSGTVFPLGVLPFWLRPVSLALPTTYWLEGVRRSLIAPLHLPPPQDNPLEAWSQPQLAAALALSTFGLWVVAVFTFRWSERRAWRLGRIDERTGI